MRAISDPGASTETQLLVEPGRSGIRRAQPEIVESVSGRLDDLFDQLPANPELSIGRQDVEVTHPADTRRGGVRIDVEPAHADHSPIDHGGKQSLARAVEPIRANWPTPEQADARNAIRLARSP